MKNILKLFGCLFLSLHFLLGCQSFTMIKKLKSGKPKYQENISKIPFSLEGHKILVKITVNNSKKEYTFILDTGAMTSIDKGAADELGLEKGKEMSFMNDSVRIYLTTLNILKLGQMSVEDFTVPVIDIKSVFGKGLIIDGFIGSDFLRFFNITIDYYRKELLLSNHDITYDSLTVRYDFDLNVSFPAWFPKVNMILNDQIKEEGMIDTGSPFFLVLNTSLLDKIDESVKKQLIRSTGLIYQWPSTSPECNYILRMESITLGKLELNNIPVIFTDLPGPTSVSLIGKEFLDKFLITLNYPAEKLILYPRDNIIFKTNIFTTGLKLQKTDDNVLIKGFWEGSQADKKGLKVKDEVLSINNKNCSELDIKEINEILNDADIKIIELTINNAGKSEKILLRKEMLFSEINDSQ